MRWLAEAAAQNMVSYLPGGERVYYALQRLTKSLPVSDETFRQKLGRALDHVRAFAEHGPARGLSESALYEFGAGWDLIVPLALHALRADSQTLVDIRPNIRLELVNDTLRKLERHRDWFEQQAGREVRMDARPLASFDELERRFGIAYLAPADARDTRLPSASFDLISSTDTLEHIPPADIELILRECRRLLRPDGIMSCRIDLEDHYRHADPSISRYNFLKFSDRAWSVLNPPLHYLNRLRYPEYLQLFRDTGFEVVSERLSRPTESDLEALRSLTPAARFRGYSLEELAVRALAIVARPRPTRSA